MKPEVHHLRVVKRARYYTLTRKGRERLVRETRKWEQMVRVISRVLKPGEAK